MIDPYDLADDDTGTVSWAGVDDATADLRGALMAAQERAARAEAAWASVHRSIRTYLVDAWEDGNCTGLDGWIGEDRGEEPDREAIEARDRKVNQLVNALFPDQGGQP